MYTVELFFSRNLSTMYINITSEPSVNDSTTMLSFSASFDVELSDFPSSLRNTLLENYKTLLSRNIQMFHDEYLRFQSSNNSQEVPSFQTTQKHLDFVSRIAQLEREKLQAQSVATNNSTAILDMKKHLDRLLGTYTLNPQPAVPLATPVVAHSQPVRVSQSSQQDSSVVESSSDEPFVPKDGIDYVTLDKIAALVPMNCEILLKHVVKEINGSAKGLSDYAVLFSKNKNHIQSYNGVEYFQRKGCHYLRKCVS